jgi:diguanylate cyclase (GGDEF)-like protein
VPDESKRQGSLPGSQRHASKRPTDAAAARSRARSGELGADATASTDPLGEVRRLVTVRRTAYRGVVAAATVAIAGYLAVIEATTGSAIDRALVGVMLVGFGFALVELFRPGGVLRRVEVSVLVAGVVALAGGLAVKLFAFDDPVVHLEAWRDFAPWAPLVYVWAYFAFGRRLGLRLSIAFYAVSVAILGGHVLADDAVAWRSLAQFYLASWAYVPGLHVFSWSLERHARALALAETAADRAFVDPLTGLPNRARFMDRLERSVALAERTGTGFAVLFVDLDGFKAVNDAYGHQAGDALLRALAARMTGTVRRSDTVARLSGDEFTVLTGEPVDTDGVRVLAGKLVAACAAPVEVDERMLRVSASVGVALFPDHGADADALVRAADAAMYVAKWGGTGRVQVGPVAKGDGRR